MYIPLFNKSNYSLLSSLLKVSDLIDHAKKQNISSIAIADTNMYATMEFIKKCETESIKPIIGLHISLDDFSIVLYAKNYDGYKSLIKLSTIQNEKQVTIEDIKKYSNELIAVLPYQDKDKYKELTNIYKELYNDLKTSIMTKGKAYPNNLYIISLLVTFSSFILVSDFKNIFLFLLTTSFR